GLLPIVLLCALLAFFPILLATVLGMRTLDPEVVVAARLAGAHGWTMLRHIQVPIVLPRLLTGLRNRLTLAAPGADARELGLGGQGLGMVLSVQATSADPTGLFATLTVLSALAIAMYPLLRAVERVAVPEGPTACTRFAARRTARRPVRSTL